MDSPRASASSSISISVTGMPALAKLIAMPPPIVPPPMMPIDSIGLCGVSFGKPSILAAWRSAKNRWRSAADCVLCMHSINRLRSTSRPSAKDSRVAASTQSTIFCGASWPRARFASAARYWSKTDGSTSGTGSSLVFRGAAPCSSSSRAQAIAPSRKSPSTILSISPISFAAAAPTGLPLTIRSSAAATPASRGERCVPPAPGNKPRFTSGKPTLADGTAHR